MRTIDLPSLTSDEAGPCGNLLTNEEIWNALNEMQNNKSPGNDGLPSEFYVTFFNLLKIDLLQCLNECWEKCELSNSQSQVILTLIEKPGKDARLIK